MNTMPLRLAVLFVATLACSIAGAQPVYRCGNAYGSVPCSQGKAIESDDARTARQRDDALRLAAAERRQGDEMERARLRREAAFKPALASALSSAPAPAVKALEKKPSFKKRAAKAKPTGKQAVVFLPAAKPPSR
jgi:hypothetical protein